MRIGSFITFDKIARKLNLSFVIINRITNKELRSQARKNIFSEADF
jgi:hypothetical protein